MTFAFEDDGESADFTPRSVARKEQQPSVSFPCVHCSATAHMSFLSQDALDRHVAQCHVESSKPGTSANAKRVWCPHCARYLRPHQTLVQHIREAHNESFEAKKSGQAHTKVVRFATDNVVDAAACSSTPAYNVLCPDSLRPVAASTDPATRADDEHQAGSSRDPARPGDNSNAQRSTGTHQQAGVSMKFKCDHCNRVLGSLKGRAYHMREKHGVPLGRSWIKGNEDANAQRATGSPPTTPPPEDLPPPVVDNDACSVSTQKVGAALLGETLRLTFPLPWPLSCPIIGCRHIFSSKKWTSMKGSLVRHLNFHHKLSNRKIQQWCARCNQRVNDKPTLHPCLSGRIVSPGDPGEGAWPCPSCDTVLTSKLGLRNHMDAHKRQEIRETMPVLSIPEGPARRKMRRRKRIAAISTGHPGDMPLAPPPQEQNVLTPPPTGGELIMKMTLHREEESTYRRHAS
ncbi:c2H2-type domain-containing protein [Trichonephila clavipes]|nr:c2H2-type domain-containing protein [Trichonephila clavipes]